MSTTSMNPATSSSQNPSLPFASRADQLVGSVIDASTTLLAAYDHYIVKFGMGAAAPDMLPANDFARIAGEVFDPANFTYGETKGEPILLEALHDYLSSTDQIPAEQKDNLDRLL